MRGRTGSESAGRCVGFFELKVRNFFFGRESAGLR